MSNGTALFFLGLAIGAFLAFWVTVIVINIPDSKLYKYHEALRVCEQDLPRNQHCIISAIPDPQPE